MAKKSARNAALLKSLNTGIRQTPNNGFYAKDVAQALFADTGPMQRKKGWLKNTPSVNRP